MLLRQVAEVEKELAETPTAESLADFEAFAREVQFGIWKANWRRRKNARC